MKYLMSFILFLLILGLAVPPKTEAIYDPLSRPNNKIGIHILFPDELSQAKELVNSSGGQWGYVTIPIQVGEKDIDKWQKFFNEARKERIIPLVRLATHADYFVKESWRKPTEEDVLDFANFLDSLKWPTKNRYIIVFNEVNRADEWNGLANPGEYAALLSYAVDTFKERNEDYFIISAGMDNAAITADGTYSQYDYFRQMNLAYPGIFNRIDGISSHAYPNPAFSQPPEVDTEMSIHSFKYEKELINSMTDKNLPIFITETGWDQTLSSDTTVGLYFIQALETVWNDPNIVAITPFLLNSGPGPFEKFSFRDKEGKENEIYKAYKRYKKIKGRPIVNNPLTEIKNEVFNFPLVDFTNTIIEDDGDKIKFFVRWLLLPL